MWIQSGVTVYPGLDGFHEDTAEVVIYQRHAWRANGYIQKMV